MLLLMGTAMERFELTVGLSVVFNFQILRATKDVHVEVV
jgi:hypothetical protein